MDWRFNDAHSRRQFTSTKLQTLLVLHDRLQIYWKEHRNSEMAIIARTVIL